MSAAIAQAAPRGGRQPADQPAASDTTRARSTTSRPTGCGCEGGRNLIAAARAAAARRRIVTQSIAFLYAPEGDWVKDEEARPFTRGAAAVRHRRRGGADCRARGARSADGLEGLVLRYGQFYGPGTYFAPGGSQADDVRRRRFPIVGKGAGTFSFIHVDDAAGATVAALDRGAPGIYNVVDDEPAPMRDWLPVYADALGAKPPLRVPTWLARLVAGRVRHLAGDRAARGLEREGQARAGLAAALSELAPGLSGGPRR